jgi:hypothetical protein
VSETTLSRGTALSCAKRNLWDSTLDLADKHRTVGWEPRLASLNVDKPNEFVRKVSAFVVGFCISRKHLW